MSSSIFAEGLCRKAGLLLAGILGFLLLCPTPSSGARAAGPGPRDLLVRKLRAARRAGDRPACRAVEAELLKHAPSPAGKGEASKVIFRASGAVGGPGDPRCGGGLGSGTGAGRSWNFEFGPDIRVRYTNLDGYEIRPSLAVDSSGVLYTAFEAFESTGNNPGYIQIYRSTDGGMTWQAHGYIMAQNKNLRDPSIAVAEGSNPTLLVAYMVEEFGTSKLYPEVATAPLGSYTFTVHSLPLWSGGQGWTKPVLWTDASGYGAWNAYLVCERFFDFPENYNVDFWRSTDFGATWGTNPKVICGNWDAEAWIDPDGAFGAPPHDRVVVVCYNRTRKALYEVYSDDFGLTFTAETKVVDLYNDPINDVDPEVEASPDSSLVMAACTYRSLLSNDQVGYLCSPDGGVTWSALYSMDGNSPEHDYGVVLHAGGGGQGWHLAYIHMVAPGQREVCYNVRPLDLSEAWMDPSPVVSDLAIYGNYGVALAADPATDRPGIVWSDNRDGGVDYDLFFDTTYSTEVYVPDDYPTIQAAVDAVPEGFTVYVRPGTYVENVDFKGKNITVVSTDGPAVTVIDGNGKGSVVRFAMLNGKDTVLDGFTLRNGQAAYGGGIYCDKPASPVLRNLWVKNNTAVSGGGMWCWRFGSLVEGCLFEGNQASGSGGAVWADETDSSQALFSGNRITGNTAVSGGGGILCLYGAPRFVNNVIDHNLSGGGGGGLSFIDSPVDVVNNVVAFNETNSQGGGIYCKGDCSGAVKNTVLFWNSAGISGDQLYFEGTAIAVGFSDVQGGWPGTDILDADPLFLDPVNGDFHLTRFSPCINMGTGAGAPPEDMDGDPRPQAGTVDVGVDEFAGVHPLEAEAYAFSEQTGCTLHLALDAGAANGGRTYLLLGGVSGKVPGIPLPGGAVVLPVNWDAFTGIVAANLNGPFFQNFFGTLDGNGTASAVLSLPPVPGMAGLVMSFAYPLKGPPWDRVSNPVDITVHP